MNTAQRLSLSGSQKPWAEGFKSVEHRFLRASCCRTGGAYRHHNGLFKYNRGLIPFFIVKLQHNRAYIVRSIIPDQSKYKVNVSDDGITLSCYLKIQKNFISANLAQKSTFLLPLRSSKNSSFEPYGYSKVKELKGSVG